MLKVAQAALAMTCFWSLSDIHECLGHIQMAPSPLDKQTANCNSPLNKLMSLGMDLAAFCDIKRQKQHQWIPFGCFSVDVAIGCHFMATHPPTTLSPYRSDSGIGYTSTNYLKWQTIQLAIHSIVGKWL